MAGGSNGYRAALVRRQLTPGLISSFPGRSDCSRLSLCRQATASCILHSLENRTECATLGAPILQQGDRSLSSPPLSVQRFIRPDVTDVGFPSAVSELLQRNRHAGANLLRGNGGWQSRIGEIHIIRIEAGE